MHFELSPPEYEKTLTIDEAIMYCYSLNIDGKVGWRLPTVTEMQELGRMELDDVPGSCWLNAKDNNHGCIFHLQFNGIITAEHDISMLSQARPVRTL
jgi:hypothetical protein